MRQLKRWLIDKDRRDMLTFLGGGLVVIVGAVWTAFTFWRNSTDTPQKIEATYNVCLGATREGCPAGTTYLGCHENIATWAKNECSSYTARTVSAKSGGMCGYTVVQVKCTTGK